MNDFYHNDVLGCIGWTPMVRLKRVTQGMQASKVLAKLEFQNPGGSVKDRIALNMIEEAEKAGILVPGKSTVVEYTSGNTGIGLAMVCAAKGYRCIIVMPQLPPMRERYMICRKFGAQVHLTAGSLGIPGMKKYVDNLLATNPDHWCPRQFENPANVDAHFKTTGPEIWQQTNGAVDIVVIGAGTGGTVVGVAKYLKQRKPELRVICVEPTESRVLVGESHMPHTVLGIGAGIPLKFVDELAPGQPWQEGPRGAIDEFLHCNSTEANQWVDRLAREEGMLVGPASGAACKVAVEVAQRESSRGKVVVAVLTSSAVRYTTHPMWGPERMESVEALPMPFSADTEPLLRWTSPME
eukprot:GGOE01030731.1.p1 GENE.GGOE01030731.1~~GGOE01030731.1.p1  ORF type:complete len:361 (+),score=115.67 GGOE01030731.1:26-1084(+)